MCRIGILVGVAGVLSHCNNVFGNEITTVQIQSIRQIPKNALPPLNYGVPLESIRTDSEYQTKDTTTSNSYNYIPVLLESHEEISELLDRIPGSELIGRLGELQNSYLISVPNTLTPDELAEHAASGLHKRDGSRDLSTASDWIPLQRHQNWHSRSLPNNRIGPQGSRENAVASLRLNDPEFNDMWNLNKTLVPSRDQLEQYDQASQYEARDYNVEPLSMDDPEFIHQWYLNNTLVPGNDVQALPVWLSQVNGYNVTISLIDDGIDYTHPDLVDSFFPDASFDFNTQSALPYPQHESDHHGTRCAGQISSRLGNGLCGVGLSYGARIAGIRLLSGPITEADEVAAFNFAYQLVDIYSNSWGPKDDGATVDGPKKFSQLSIVNAAEKGRNGLGNIMIFAAGNGGEKDNCNYDGFANNLWTVSVGALDIYNEVPWYAEPCVAHMVVAYSSNTQIGITTTDRGGQCTSSHGGTSAAAPLASATVALILSIRPDLSVRDIHDILRKSAVQITPSTTASHTPIFIPEWTQLPSKLSHSDYYGYGRIDSERALAVARVHSRLPPRIVHTLGSGEMNITIPCINVTSIFGLRLPHLNSINVGNCTRGLAVDQGLVVERVGVRVWLAHPRRGYLCIQLISPSGIISNLATPRPPDRAKTGLTGWMFTSVKHWGEPASGEWRIAVGDLGSDESLGQLTRWELEIHGHAGGPSGEVIDTSHVDRHPPPQAFNWLYVIIPGSGVMVLAVIVYFAVNAYKRRSQEQHQALRTSTIHLVPVKQMLAEMPIDSTSSSNMAKIRSTALMNSLND